MFKNLLYFAILSTVLVISWIAFGIYHNATTSTISDDTSIRIVPIPPHFDIETIAKLKSKKVIKANLSAGPIATPTSNITANKPATSGTSQITTTPTSTPSGQTTGGGL